MSLTSPPRSRADWLGERFDLSAFHSVVLRNGNLPLPVLERLVDAYIAEGADWIDPTAAP